MVFSTADCNIFFHCERRILLAYPPFEELHHLDITHTHNHCDSFVIVLEHSVTRDEVGLTLSSTFSKIFSIKLQDLVDDCRMLFNCQPVAHILSSRKKIFLCKFINFNSAVCSLFDKTTTDECAKMYYHSSYVVVCAYDS